MILSFESPSGNSDALTLGFALPRIVDHNAKRRAVVELARGLIRTRGVHGVSMRDIAQAAGSSTAIVSHYFADKGELLLHIYREGLIVARERRRHLPRNGVEGVMLLCRDILPTDQDSRETWVISLAFTAMSTTDDRFATEFRENILLAREQFRVRLHDLVNIGSAPAGFDCDWGARQLLALLHGVATEAVIDPSDWPPERQLAVMQAGLDTMLR
jgi:AcrR family transcriptional regulator